MFFKIDIKKKLLLFFCVFALLAVIMGAVAISAILISKKTVKIADHDYITPLFLTDSIVFNYSNIHEAITPSPVNSSLNFLLLKKIFEETTALQNQLSAYRNHQIISPVVEIIENKNFHFAALWREIKRSQTSGNLNRELINERNQLLIFSRNEITVITQMRNHCYKMIQNKMTNFHNAHLKYGLFIVLAMIIAIGLPFSFFYNINTGFLQPLTKCAASIPRVSEKDYHFRFPEELLEREDVIGELSNNIYRAWVEFIRYIEERENESKIKLEDINKELSRAYHEISTTYQELEKTKNDLNAAEYELEDAHQDTQQAVRLKAEFLSLITNELRTPLTGILGFSEFLLVDKKLDNSTRECVNYIHESGNRLYKLIDEIIMLAMIEAGNLATEYTAIQFNELINDLKILYKSEILKKKIDFSFTSDIETLIYTDNIKLRQILFNLVGNAIKFTLDGKVSVHLAKTDENYYSISVVDTGYGIDAANFDKVYNMFWQEAGTHERKHRGIGVGLAITKKLVDALNGKIRFESEKGSGSSFTVELPIPADAENQVINLDKDFQKREDFTGIKIIFAEDDMIHHEFLKNILNRFENVQFTGFYNGAEVIEELERKKDYNLVILDIQMPVMDGISCVSKIRQLKWDIPVIALTAYYRAGEDEALYDAGFNDVAIKPINIPELEKKIQNLLAVKLG